MNGFPSGDWSAVSGLERAVAKVSRLKGPRCILRQLRALIIRNHRSLVGRATTPAEAQWSRQVHDALTGLVRAGDAALPWHPEPRRIRCRARKREAGTAAHNMRTIP